MKFSTPNADVVFEIPDDWWAFAEMESFDSKGAPCYVPPTCYFEQAELVPLSTVEPPKRDPGTPLFRKYKLLPVLFGLQSPEQVLPPVSVERIDVPGKYQFRVKNGCHRFYASVAVGYSKLPVRVLQAST
jgi:hypothetical protein